MGLSCFKSWKHDSAGHKGNRDVLASPGSYFFLSNSAGQGDEWLKSLNKGVWIPFTGVFGQSLEETVLYERRYGVRLVPLVVEQCATFIRERGLHEVGLFRQPGRASLVKELQEAFDAGERPTFDSSTDVHTVASLLKLYLRQLPEPLVPYSCYQDFLLCARRLRSERSQGLVELRNLLHELPVANFNLLSFICQFLNEVQSYSGSNKMSGQNLATVFGPNILRAKAEDPQSLVGGAALVHVLMLELIREHESLFAKVAPPISTRPSPVARRQSHLQPSPCLRQLSMPLIAERAGEPGRLATDDHDYSRVHSAATNSDSSWAQKRLLGHRYTSSHPENCFYPLPTSSQEAGPGPSSSTNHSQLQEPLWDNPKPRLVLMGWTKAWNGPVEADAGLWSSGAAGEEVVVQEPTSGGSSEAQEDSTPSAYDNLDRVSSCQQMDDDVTGGQFEASDPGGHIGSCEKEAELKEARQRGDSSSSWSSCEVLPLDECSDEVGHNSDNDRHEDTNSHTHDEDDDDDDDERNHHPNSPVSVLSDCPLSTGSSEVFLPSAPPDLHVPEAQSQSWEDQSLLARLQQQMSQQKAEYQARIQRLERCNDVLKRQVAVLRVSLEQQKRSQSVAEIKIRHMERAKADADRRNNTLQREMALFFQMYGEIRRRGRDGGRGGGSL